MPEQGERRLDLLLAPRDAPRAADDLEVCVLELRLRGDPLRLLRKVRGRPLANVVRLSLVTDGDHVRRNGVCELDGLDHLLRVVRRDLHVPQRLVAHRLLRRAHLLLLHEEAAVAHSLRVAPEALGLTHHRETTPFQTPPLARFEVVDDGHRCGQIDVEDVLIAHRVQTLDHCTQRVPVRNDHHSTPFEKAPQKVHIR